MSEGRVRCSKEALISRIFLHSDFGMKVLKRQQPGWGGTPCQGGGWVSSSAVSQPQECPGKAQGTEVVPGLRGMGTCGVVTCPCQGHLRVQPWKMKSPRFWPGQVSWDTLQRGKRKKSPGKGTWWCGRPKGAAGQGCRVWSPRGASSTEILGVSVPS